MLQRLEALLTRPRAPLWLGLFAVLFCLPSLRFGLQADDHMFPLKLEEGAPPWALFELEREDVPALRERGVLVWWASPELQARFLRPLASLSHALDFSLWPNAVWLMRLFNALLYGACVYLAAWLYRRLTSLPALAALAGLLFAVDDGHAFSAGWISGRNTLLALLFSLLALALHLRARAGEGRRFYALSAAAVALALGSAEAGVWSVALLLSHALTLDTAPWRERVRALSPSLLVALGWAAVYVGMHCGFTGSSFYRDPSTPLTTLREGMLDLPIWIADLFGPSGYPFALIYPTLWVRVLTLPVALLLGWLLLPALRASPPCRFFALATLLCLVPLFSTQPTSRVLLGPSFGALGWVACSIVRARERDTRGARWVARVLLGVHLVLAVLLFVPALRATETFAHGTTQLSRAAKPGRDVVLVRSPVELLSVHALSALTTRAREREAPRTLHQLYSGSSALWAERIDERTLDIEVARGWGHVIMERVFCAAEHMPHEGSETRLGAYTARVLASNADGMPERVRFVFPTPLESSERQWLIWDGNRALPWTPPKPGERAHIPPLRFFLALLPDR